MHIKTLQLITIVVCTEIIRTQDALYTGRFEAIEFVSPVTRQLAMKLQKLSVVSRVCGLI